MSVPARGGVDQVLAPRYRNVRTGYVAGDPLAVADAEPIVDLAALARLFTSPALTGEFLPGAYWCGVRMEWDLPARSNSGIALDCAFSEELAALCADCDAVGVKLSGGVDSFAVLCRVATLYPHMRIVAYCVNLIDDRGVGCEVVTRRLVQRVRAATSADVELVVINPAECADEPVWSALGPRLDALPAANATVAAQAESDGVTVLLCGDGADELLGAPSYLTVPVLAAHGVRGAVRHLADARRSGPGWGGELLAALADRFPTPRRTRWYWAANWPQWCNPSVAPVLAESRRSEGLEFAQGWVDTRLREHMRHDRRWAAADADDAFWPRTYLSPAGSVPEASPFLCPAVVTAALAMPLAARYQPQLPTVYQRYKAAVVDLLPEWARSVLPASKQYFTRALAESTAETLPIPFAEAVELLDAAALAECADTATRMTAAAVEKWLADAYAAGHRIPGIKAWQGHGGARTQR